MRSQNEAQPNEYLAQIPTVGTSQNARGPLTAGGIFFACTQKYLFVTMPNLERHG
jgi:hypothetical protein